jgi:flavin-dependent dehydrogenase
MQSRLKTRIVDKGNIVLIGAAAGLRNLITGEGNRQAIMSGITAEETVRICKQGNEALSKL